MSSIALMAGIDIPDKLGRGKPKPEHLEPWLRVVAVLLGRGVRSPSELRKLLDINYRTAENWIAQVRSRWAQSLSDERINWRREKLFTEADEVARIAWLDVMTADTASERSTSLKIVLEANKRKASLCGLDKLEIKLDAKVKTTTTVDMVQRVEHTFGLAPGALETIGRDAAQLISVPLVDAEIVDGVEPVSGLHETTAGKGSGACSTNEG